MKSIKIPEKFKIWIEARKRFHLSHAHIQMARELGLNPKKLGKIANTKEEPWKAPLPQFLEHIYFRRFHKTMPDTIMSIEEIYKEKARKKALKKIAKLEEKERSL